MARERISQEEWDRRAADVGIEWLDTVETTHQKKRARCLGCGYTWSVSPAWVNSGGGCAECGRKRAAVSRRVSQEVWDERASAAGFIWLEPVASSKRVRARCLTCNLQWLANPGNTAGRGDGCPVCGLAHRRVSQDAWDERAAAVNIEWLEPVGGVQSITPARCRTCGAEWNARPNKVQQGAGCWKCDGRREPRFQVTQDEWDERAAAVGVEWLDEVGGRNDNKTAALCRSCGYEWKAWPISIQSGSGCPECARDKMSEAKQLPTDVWLNRAKEKNLVWLGEVTSSKTPTPARCLTCGNEWEAMPVNLRRGRGCPQCDIERRAALARRPQDEWNRIAEQVGLKWLEPVESSNRPAKAKCLSCDYEWDARPGKRAEGSGCPVCSATGFDPSRPSLVYLIDDGDGNGKVGITNADRRRSRIRQHELNGWQLSKAWKIKDGETARNIERSVLNWWRYELKLPPTRPRGTDGWTETVSTDDLPLTQIIEHITRLVDGSLGCED